MVEITSCPPVTGKRKQRKEKRETRETGKRNTPPKYTQTYNINIIIIKFSVFIL
jgi:hypothetical protein